MDDPRARGRGSGNAEAGSPSGTGPDPVREAAPAPRARLFAALWPPPDVVARLAALARPASAGVRWVVPASWHVTLAFLGNVDERRVDALGAALAAAAARAPGPSEALLGPATARLGRSVLAVPVEGVDVVARSVRAALEAVLAPGPDDGAGAGAGGGARHATPVPQAFRGHLTLARATRNRPVPLALCGVAVEARWIVQEVCLVRSDLGAEGARYTTLARATVLS